ncbi:BnaC09g12620D [Brassica napus]|uniref:BnaC09g12620D protein n=1 Tax=Brassica napus TaxID=3708 RepID=A0A078F5K0_BRANA|nr:BnaC09g12620D [Brassica napus]
MTSHDVLAHVSGHVINYLASIVVTHKFGEIQTDLSICFVKDFVGALIYDDYEDDFCRDPCHNTDVKSKEVDMSPQSRLISPIDIHEINGDMTRETLFDRPIVTHGVESYYVPVTNLTDEPIYDVSDDEVFIDSHYCIDPLFNDEDEVQGFNNGGDFHVVVDDDNICVLKEHINYGLGEKDSGAWSRRLTENGWRSVIYATRTTGTSDTKITTTKYLCGISMGAHLIFLERPWKYDRRMSSNSFSNSFGNTYDFVFQDTKNTFYLIKETIDPVVLKKEIVSVSSTTSMQIGNVPSYQRLNYLEEFSWWT